VNPCWADFLVTHLMWCELKQFNYTRCNCTRSCGSSVSIVSNYGLDDREFDLRQRQMIFLLASVSRPGLTPTQPPVQWVLGVVSRGWSAAGAWHWPLTTI